jgi:hypothetical protein
VDHNNLTRPCIDCHNGDAATGMVDAPGLPHPQLSVELNDDCGICHNTRSFELVGVFDHGAVDFSLQRCDSCHNDSTAPNAPGVVQGHPVIPQIPNSTEPYDCGSCHYTTDFAWTEGFDHTVDAVINNTCESCHNNSPTGTATGMHAEHIPISVYDCGTCHVPGTFTSGSFDHDALLPNFPAADQVCSRCHNGTNSVGKPPTHIETTAECDTCHDVVSFSGATFSHTPETIGAYRCEDCHNGETATGQKVNHIPIDNNDCGACHGTDTFAPSTFLDSVHVGYTADCATCHDGQLATGKPRATHIPTRDDCSTCHTSNAFMPTVFWTDVHPTITRGCEGCHNGQFTTGDNRIKGKPALPDAHVPTDQDCHFCHNATTNDWAVSAQSDFSHEGITDNCVSCHDGTFAGIGALGATDIAIHNESPNTDCGACHTTTAMDPNGVSFANHFADHTNLVDNCARSGCHTGLPGEAIGKPTDHIQTDADCVLCHVSGGSFATAVFDHNNVPDSQRCDDCHNGTDATGIQDKTGTQHIPINDQDCRVCHNTTAFAGANFNHDGIEGGCSECHNGVTAIGKDANHVPTNSECNNCHQTTGFIPATFDHTGIVDNCEACHDGTLAIGKPDNHIPTNDDCSICHNPQGFTPVEFQHVGIVDGCSDCHNNNPVIGKPQDHMPTDLDCHFCHTTATFVGGSWIHDDSTAGICDTCHNGNDATGQPRNGHFDTSEQCDACHTTNGWAPASEFDHCPNTANDTCSANNYPGDHRVNPSCIACHTDNSQTIRYPSQTYEGSCAACHARDYDAGEHRGTLSQNRDCGDSGCHSVRDRNWD